MGIKFFKTLRWAFILLITHIAMGQVEFVPFSDSDPYKIGSRFSQKPNFNNTVALNLPFFDDFSTYLGAPSQTLWDSLGGAKVVLGSSYHPPTLGAAMFDGLDETGMPYEFRDGFPKGATDYLESQPIDLSTYFPGDSLYLSFYWQQGGRGEAPEFSHRDSLMLDFWDDIVDSTWIFHWGRIARSSDSTLVTDPSVILNDTFFIAMIPITDPRYFNTNFRFRFRTRGTQSGSFDIWNVDYVFLDANRGKDSIFFKDRAITETIGTIFKNFSAIPASHAVKVPSDSLFRKTNSTQVRNLWKIFSVYDFDVQVKDEIKDTTFYQRGFNGNLISGYFKTQTIRDTTFSNAILVSGDSQVISKTFLLTGVTDDPGFDVNNALSIYGPLMDFYAYDDGNSEGSMGIRTSFGKV